MRGKSRIIALALAFGLGGPLACRASFENVNTERLISSGDNLGSPGTRDATPQQPPELVVERELPREESPVYECDGTVVVTEKGRDANRDGVLQPNEVTEVTSRCEPDGPVSPHRPADPPPALPPACPKAGGKDCRPDDPHQNDPGQSRSGN